MKRFNVAKNIINRFLPEDSFVLVYGDTLSRELFELDKDNILYLGSEITPSVIIGLAMCTKKKILLFCTNEDIIFNLYSFIQIALSKLKNIICVVFDSNINEDTLQASLFRQVGSVRGVLFNMGFIVHDYTNFFDNKPPNEVKISFNRVVGPICVLIKTSNGVNSNLKNTIYLEDNIKRFKTKFQE